MTTSSEKPSTHWLTSGKPASQVSKELGISNANLLYNWKQRFAPDDAGGRAAARAKPATLAEATSRLELAEREIGDKAYDSNECQRRSEREPKWAV